MYSSIVPLGVKDPVFLHNFGDNWDCGIYRVGNNKHICFWGRRRNACSKVSHDSSIDLDIIRNEPTMQKRNQSNLEEVISADFQWCFHCKSSDGFTHQRHVP